MLKIWAAHVEPSVAAAPTQPAGTVVDVQAEAILIATGQGLLTITELQPAGRRHMRVREFLAGHPVRVGERFLN